MLYDLKPAPNWQNPVFKDFISIYYAALVMRYPLKESVCVCVCVREAGEGREGEKGREGERERGSEKHTYTHEYTHTHSH